MDKHSNKIEWSIYCSILLLFFLLKPILAIVFILIMIFLYPKYKIFNRAKRIKRIRILRQGNPDNVNSKPHWPGIAYLGGLLAVPFGFFLLYRYLVTKIITATRDSAFKNTDKISWVENVDKVPDWIWFIPIGLVVIWVVWYFWGLISSKTSAVWNKAKNNFSRKRRSWWKLLWIPVIYIIGFGLVEIWKQNKKGKFEAQETVQQTTTAYYRKPDLSSFEELKIGKKNIFKADVWKKFKFKPSNTEDQKYLNFYTEEGTTAPVILTFEQASNGREWQWKLWREADGTPQSKLLSGYLEAFSGDCLIKADKDSKVLVLIE